MKIGPLNDWDFVRWCLLGAVAFSLGSVGGTPYRLTDMMAKPLPSPLPIFFSPTDGLLFGVLVPLTFYTIAKIAARPVPGGPGAPPEERA